MASEDELVQRLQELQKQLGKRQSFEEALNSIKSLLRDRYSSASPTTQKVFYTVISRVATVLRTRYTASSPGYLLSGIELFEAAERLTSNASEKSHFRTCIRNIRDELNQPENSSSTSSQQQRGYLFEGHLTVDPEPQQPAWLMQQNLLTALAAQAESQTGNINTETGGIELPIESVETMLHGLIESLDNAIPPELFDAADVRGAPPASKDVVAKLPVIAVNEAVLGRMGEGAECCICKEVLVVGDEMQEMPCKHVFHPPCLKPWLDEHNSCPICRHELPTDDHVYEARKEREKELEEERRGAANAVRGGEFIATSVDVEEQLYQLATDQGITVVTSSQRPALIRFHARELHLIDGEGNWELRAIKQ